MTDQRLTKVQKDVLERMRDGWTLVYGWYGWTCYELRKSGEPTRHVRRKTGDSLYERGLVRWDSESHCGVLV